MIAWLYLQRWLHGLAHITHRGVTVYHYGPPSYRVGRRRYIGCTCGRVWRDELEGDQREFFGLVPRR